MNVLLFVSQISIILFLGIVVLFGVFEKKNVLELFITGCYDGVKVILDIFPTLMALIISVGMLRSSGIILGIGNLFEPIFNFLKFPKEIISLVLLRPISGSTTTAVATDLMKNYGVDSKIRIISFNNNGGN